jgi:hypothetical protein
MMPLPQEETMTNPCEGVPRNRWCRDGQPVGG